MGLSTRGQGPILRDEEESAGSQRAAWEWAPHGHPEGGSQGQGSLQEGVGGAQTFTGPRGGSYPDSAGSAPGAAPGCAAAAQGQSGPGQAPHWG